MAVHQQASRAHAARSAAAYVITKPAPARRIEVVRLGERAAPVQPAALGGGLDRRVLAAHLVGADRDVEPGAGRGQDVERGHRGLDQQHVGALGDVDRHLAHRLAAVGRVHLVAAPVAERGVEPAASRNGP